MYHRPFEDWLLEEEPLTTEQEAALQEHLQSCTNCSQLSKAWKVVEVDLHRAPMLAPQAGFADRWQTRLEADRRQLHRRQSFAALFFSLGGAALLFGSLAIMALPVLASPRLLLWTWVLRLLDQVFYASELQETFISLLHIQTGIISPGVWIVLAGVFSMLVAIWVASLRVVAGSRRAIE